MSATDPVKLIFPSIPEDEMEVVLWEIGMKQWCHAVAETADGVRYRVSFITPLRAQQDLEYANSCIHLGLIIVPETTREAMERAILSAWNARWFESLRPIADPDIGDRNLPPGD